METISFQGKHYNGKLIYQGMAEGYEIRIYALVPFAKDKFLVLHKQQDKVKEFMVTGLDKIFEIMELTRNSEMKKTKRRMFNKLKELKRQSTIKSLNKVDTKKFKNYIARFYDANYSLFVVAGIKFQELLNLVEKI